MFTNSVCPEGYTENYIESAVSEKQQDAVRINNIVSKCFEKCGFFCLDNCIMSQSCTEYGQSIDDFCASACRNRVISLYKGVLLMHRTPSIADCPY